MNFKKELNHFFTPKKWKTVFRGTCNAQRRIFGVPSGTVECAVVFKVTTNKRNVDYRCYYTDGDSRNSLDLNLFLLNYPEANSILDEYGIEA